MMTPNVQRFTKHGIYYPTDTEDLVCIASLFKGEKFLDLGSGDNRVVDFANSNGANAFGAEIENGEDMFDLDWNKFDILYYYLLGCKDEGRVINRLNYFKGTFILYHKHCPVEAIDNFEKYLNLLSFSKSQYINIYTK